MEGQAKARINLNEGTIELDGSEAFVSRYLDDFKQYLGAPAPSNVKTNLVKQENSSTVVKPQAPDPTKQKSPTTKKPAKGKITKPEQFDIAASGNKPSLADFIAQKKPNKALSENIAAVGFYIMHHNNQEYFTEGNVEFAYRVPGLDLGKRPLSMRQAFIDARSKKFYVEEIEREGVEGAWVLQPLGERFVEDLPR